MNDQRVCVLVGRAYRGELIHEISTGQVIMFPTWLGGVRAEFASENEAKAFVDARFAVCQVSDVKFQAVMA